MTLRDATVADAAALSALESACFPDDAWSGASLASHLETPLCLACLLEEGGEVIGYASGRALPPEAGNHVRVLIQRKVESARLPAPAIPVRAQTWNSQPSMKEGLGNLGFRVSGDRQGARTRESLVPPEARRTLRQPISTRNNAPLSSVYQTPAQ